MTIDIQHLRMVEALLFAAKEPLDEATLAARLPEDADVPAILSALEEFYDGRGVNLAKLAGRWTFLTAEDLGYLLKQEKEVPRKLSRAAVETLAIIAYHQPITRTEIEEVRGVALSKGTLDVLFEAGWIKPRGRRRTPGRPVTYGTADDFLIHFGLEKITDLPGLEELKAAGLLTSNVPTGLFGGLDAEESPQQPLFDAEEIPQTPPREEEEDWEGDFEGADED